jgi:ABC-type sugar transport system, periplasmic component
MKTSSKKLMVLALSVVIAFSAFAGECSANSQVVSNAQKQETVKISLMDLWAKNNTENICTSVRQQLRQFGKSNKNIVVTEEGIGDQTAYYTKLDTLAASDSLPDIFVCKGSELAKFAKSQVVASLDKMLSADKTWKNGYVPSAFDDLTSGGSIYAVPYSMLSTSVVYYNKKMLAKVGYNTFPKTWNNFLTMIQKLKATGVTPIALGNKDQWVAESCILSALGDRFTGTSWFKSILNNKGAKFTDAGFVKALTALQQLGTSGAFNKDMNSIDNTQQETLYFSGKAAMFIEGSWAIGAVASGPNKIAASTGVAILPAVNSEVGKASATSGGSGSGFAVGIKGYQQGKAKQQAIATVLKAISGSDYSKLIAAKGEPVAYKVTNYDKSKVSGLARQYATMASGLTFTPIYDSYLDPAVINVMNAGLQEILIGAVTPKALAANIQSEYEKVYKK